ncbi:hypothetical protein G6F59_018288 [Rhizopus arrhizus]|nr:hypothetical protein G6F59_018288 [Rhizopus arrhizus]
MKVRWWPLAWYGASAVRASGKAKRTPFGAVASLAGLSQPACPARRVRRTGGPDGHGSAAPRPPRPGPRRRRAGCPAPGPGRGRSTSRCRCRPGSGGCPGAPGRR